jgi:hypothetical protein
MLLVGGWWITLRPFLTQSAHGTGDIGAVIRNVRAAFSSKLAITL